MKIMLYLCCNTINKSIICNNEIIKSKQPTQPKNENFNTINQAELL